MATQETVIAMHTDFAARRHKGEFNFSEEQAHWEMPTMVGI